MFITGLPSLDAVRLFCKASSYDIPTENDDLYEFLIKDDTFGKSLHKLRLKESFVKKNYKNWPKMS